MTVSVSLWFHPILNKCYPLSSTFLGLGCLILVFRFVYELGVKQKDLVFYQAKANMCLCGLWNGVYSKLACSLFSRLTCFLQSMLLNFVVFICSIFINTVCTYIYHTGQLGLGPCHLNRVGHCFHAKIFGPTHVVISVQVLWSYIWIWDQIQQILIVIWA